MNYFLLIGVALAVWTLLLLMSSERLRQLNELDLKREQALAARRKREEKAQEIPTIG